MADYAFTFDSGVYDASKFNPQPLNLSLSGVSNQVVLSATSSTGTSNGVDVYGVLYDAQPSTSFGPLSSITLTSPDGSNTVIRTNLSAGATLATVNTDNLTVTYTLPAGGAATLAPASSGYNLAVGPEMRRKFSLGYL